MRTDIREGNHDTMPIRSFVKGLVRKVREKFYAPVYRQIKSIGARTEAIFTSAGIKRITPDEVRKRGLSPDIPPDTLIIPSSVSPFSAKVLYDPRFRRYIDQSTKQIISKAEMRDQLNLHRREVLLVSAKQRRPDLSDKDIIAIVDQLELDRQALKDAIAEGVDEVFIDQLWDDIEELLGELGAKTP